MGIGVSWYVTGNSYIVIGLIFSVLRFQSLIFNWKMNKDSAFIYEHHTNHKGSRISQGSLNSVLSYLKGLGNRRCYLAIKSRNAYLMGLAKNTGFNKFQRLRLYKMAW